MTLANSIKLIVQPAHMMEALGRSPWSGQVPYESDARPTKRRLVDPIPTTVHVYAAPPPVPETTKPARPKSPPHRWGKSLLVRSPSGKALMYVAQFRSTGCAVSAL